MKRSGIAAGLACALALTPLAAAAAEEPPVMNYIAVTVKPETEAAFLTWVQQHVVPMTKASPGYLGGSLFKDTMEPHKYLVLGRWTSRAAMDSWMKREGELVRAADPALITPLRGNVKEEPTLFELKAVPFRSPGQ